MKPLAWLTWPLVAVFLGCLAVVFGIPCWLIATGKADASLLVAPFVVILGAIATGFSAYSQYLKGKYEVPPWMKDPAVQKIMQSLPPPDVFPSLSDALVPVVDEHEQPLPPR